METILTVNTNNFNEYLKKGLSLLNISYDKELLEKIIKYYELFKIRSSEFNLSTLISEKDFLISHLFDSISGYETINKISNTKTIKKIVDIGTGAGFPGVVLALLDKNLQIILSEVNKKKLKFLNEAIKILELKNISVIDPSQQKIEKKINIVTARAFGNMTKIFKEAKKYQKKLLISAYKGKKNKIDEELGELSNILGNKYIYEILPVKVPFLDAERNMVNIYSK